MPNHKLNVTAYEDPKVSGVTCFLSRAKKGGLMGGVGLAEDPSDASIACRQTGPIKFINPIENDNDGETVFEAKLSPLFKGLTVSRHYDKASNTLVYLTRSNKLIDGSPKNSISAVTLMPWENDQPDTPKFE